MSYKPRAGSSHSISSGLLNEAKTTINPDDDENLQANPRRLRKPEPLTEMGVFLLLEIEIELGDKALIAGSGSHQNGISCPETDKPSPSVNTLKAYFRETVEFFVKLGHGRWQCMRVLFKIRPYTEVTISPELSSRAHLGLRPSNPSPKTSTVVARLCTPDNGLIFLTRAWPTLLKAADDVLYSWPLLDIVTWCFPTAKLPFATRHRALSEFSILALTSTAPLNPTPMAVNLHVASPDKESNPVPAIATVAPSLETAADGVIDMIEGNGRKLK
mmetsp:Transcript_6784/g.14247  ORF Transcript_6784/g.14247 Transcript_6784/m.14247 type:complete len:273 (+) Transcript_6784:2-820(+)